MDVPSQTMRHRATIGAAAVVGASALVAMGGRVNPRTVRPDGIGAIRFGVPKAAAVAELSRLFARRPGSRLQHRSRVGSKLWRTPTGLAFAVDAKRDPVSASSRIVEIKIGTCGDF